MGINRVVFICYLVTILVSVIHYSATEYRFFQRSGNKTNLNDSFDLESTTKILNCASENTISGIYIFVRNVLKSFYIIVK